MATPATSNYPPPLSADVFEEMVLDAMKIRLGRDSLARYGRSGQKQGGIDGFDAGAPPGENIVWQATLTRPTDALAKILQDVETFDKEAEFSARTYYATLGFSRDTHIQVALHKLSAKRMSKGKCAVEPVFWEDIRGTLVGRPEMREKHFAAFGDPAASAAASLQREKLEHERSPQVDAQWGTGQIAGEQYERRKLRVRNVGTANVRVVRARLLWQVRGGDAVTERRVHVGSEILMQGQELECTVQLDAKEVMAANDAASLPKAEKIQDVPLRASVELVVRSEPAAIERTIEVEFERIVMRESRAANEILELRAELLRCCYRALMSEGPAAWMIWQSTEAEKIARIARLVREATWLADQGYLEADPSSDSVILRARLTSKGRDHVERHADELGVDPTSS